MFDWEQQDNIETETPCADRALTLMLVASEFHVHVRFLSSVQYYECIYVKVLFLRLQCYLLMSLFQGELCLGSERKVNIKTPSLSQ